MKKMYRSRYRIHLNYLNCIYQNRVSCSVNYSTKNIETIRKTHQKDSNDKTSEEFALPFEDITNKCVKNSLSKLTSNDEVQKISPVRSPVINIEKKVSKLGKKSVKDDESKRRRFNDFNVQMLSASLYKQIFGEINDSRSKADEETIEKYTNILKKHNLLNALEEFSDIELNLPKLKGSNIAEHFWNIGEKQSGPYRMLLEELISGIPDKPKAWLFEPGWTRYTGDGCCEKVNFPKEDALILDVEVCLSEGDMPTLATAVTNKAWYGWVSSDLAGISKKKTINKKTYSTDQLIPLESDSKTNGYKLNGELKIPRIVVGHNVSFDRTRVKEQYWLERTGLRFMDTMSMHVAISGVTSYQKALLKSEKSGDNDWKSLSSLNSLAKVHELYCGHELSKEKRDTFISGSLDDVRNEFDSLIDYCSEDTLATYRVLSHLLPIFLSRFPHPVTLAGMLELGSCYLPVNSNWKRYIDDANRTYDDLENETKYLLTKRADQACHMLHNDEYKNSLWLWDLDWSLQHLALKKSPTKATKRKTHEETNSEESMENNPEETIDEKCKSNLLLKEVQETSSSINRDDIFSDFSQEYSKKLKEKLKDIMDKNELLPVKSPLLPGYPSWYRKLCSKPKLDDDWVPGPNLISTSMQTAPKLLSLTWKSMPLHYIRGQGWGYLVPYETSVVVPDEENMLPKSKFYDYCLHVNSNIFCSCQVTAGTDLNTSNIIDNTILHENVQNNLVKFSCPSSKQKKRTGMKKKDGNNDDVFCKAKIHPHKIGFIKLPHKNGGHLNVGNPLAKDFVYRFSENELGSSDPQARRIINISRMLSYWRNHSDRIEEQIVVWLNKKDVSLSLRNSVVGAILPQVIVNGTLTRRAVERTWMTASNAVDERIGSELRAMIQAPPGYSIVGADVDAQELWIASLLGDANAIKEHGATPLGWMTLSGQKSHSTDMHSVTAKAVGITRTHAKIINYARIYGAGQLFAEQLLKQFNPDMTIIEAKDKARKMFAMTKGMRIFRLKDDILPDVKKRTYTRYTAYDLCKLFNKSVDEIFCDPKWQGGSESAMFNRLEEIASSAEPKTPFLQCRLSRALEPHNDVQDRFLPTRVNWVVQSGAVDFLHLMLVSMRWLLGPEPRFCLSFHDEIRYLVRNDVKYQAALALHVTNLLVRSFCVHQLGMVDLPRSVAFFSSVEVDTVLRKEADNDCITPSNPYGLSKGYGIQLGESLDIDAAIKKADGVVGIHRCNRKPL